MTDSSDVATSLKINIKGPSDLKLAIEITSDQTVRQLKEAIEKQKPDVPADAQRLIYAGKVLKDEEALSVYKVKDGNTIHMVKSAARSAPGRYRACGRHGRSPARAWRGRTARACRPS